jgi:hypothetical protein
MHANTVPAPGGRPLYAIHSSLSAVVVNLLFAAHTQSAAKAHATLRKQFACLFLHQLYTRQAQIPLVVAIGQ